MIVPHIPPFPGDSGLNEPLLPRLFRRESDGDTRSLPVNIGASHGKTRPQWKKGAAIYGIVRLRTPLPTPDSSFLALQKSEFVAFSGCTTGGTPLKIVCIAVFAMHRKSFVVTFISAVTLKKRPFFSHFSGKCEKTVYNMFLSALRSGPVP